MDGESGKSSEGGGMEGVEGNTATSSSSGSSSTPSTSAASSKEGKRGADISNDGSGGGGGGGGSDSSDMPSVAATLEFVKVLAQQPTEAFDGCGRLKTSVLRLRKALHPSQPVSAPKRQRRSELDPRMPAPTLFPTSTESTWSYSMAPPRAGGLAHAPSAPAAATTQPEGQASSKVQEPPAKPVASGEVAVLDRYLDFVGAAFYSAPEAGYKGGEYGLLRRSTLGRLKASIRPKSLIDSWTPYEIAIFESAMCTHGKAFPVIANLIGTKSGQDVVQFYYLWKKSKNYRRWKETYRQLR